MMEKYAQQKEQNQAKARVKEEEPTRRSSRVRHSKATGDNFCKLAGLTGDSIYCEDDKELEKFFYNDETEYLMQVMREENKVFGTKRKRKQKTKQALE
jgi:hypothetical protein